MVSGESTVTSVKVGYSHLPASLAVGNNPLMEGLGRVSLILLTSCGWPG